MGSDNMTEQFDLTTVGNELNQVKNDVKRLAGEWANRGSEAAEQASNAVEKVGSKVVACARQAAQKTTKFVQERPATAAVVAAGVLGLIVGGYMLCNRK